MRKKETVNTKSTKVLYTKCDICGEKFDDIIHNDDGEDSDVGEIWMTKGNYYYTLNVCHGCMEEVVFKWFKRNFNVEPQESWIYNDF